MDLRDEALRWLEESEQDLRAIAGNIEAGAFNWACFIAQQAAEKAVKAVRIDRGEDVLRIRSVTALIRGDKRRGLPDLAGLSAYLEDAQELDQHYIPARYPNVCPLAGRTSSTTAARPRGAWNVPSGSFPPAGRC